MRLFKRPSTSPQLVSAAPIIQDAAPEIQSKENEKIASISGRRKDENTTGENSGDVTIGADDSAASSVISARKGISTWGRKVGRRWERLRRSESAELLSMSGRRRRWSPNDQIINDTEKPEVCGSSGVPKRISRVESLRNLFRASERSKEDGRIAEVEDEDEAMDHCERMEKAFSDGALRGSMFFPPDSNFRKNPETKKRPFAKITLNDDDFHRKSSRDLGRASSDDTRTNLREEKMENCRRVLFDDGNNLVRGRRSENGQRSSSFAGGLDELMQALRLGCDESGYDSDSTRAGADSPDSEKNDDNRGRNTSAKRRSFSITSEDYQGIDLSLTMMSTPKKKFFHGENVETTKITAEAPKSSNSTFENANEALGSVENSNLDDTMKTETTLVSEHEDGAYADTDSCNEDEFSKCHHDKVEIRDKSTKKHVEKSLIVDDKVQGRSRSKKDTSQTAKRRMAVVGRRASNASVLNLLENADSPCKDSPPACKVKSRDNNDFVGYYSPKRPRSLMESECDESTLRRTIKRPQTGGGAEETISGTARRRIGRRELRTVRLEVAGTNGIGGDVGMRLEKRDAARPYYVVACLEENGRAAASGMIGIGDEVVRISGRRLRGVSAIEARNAMKNSTGSVELRIAREASYERGGSLERSMRSSERLVRDSERIGLVRDSEMIGLVRDSERIGLVRDSEPIGLVPDSEPIGLVRDSEMIGSVQSSEPIGLVRDPERIGLVRDSEMIGSVQSSEPIGLVRDSDRIGSIQSSKTIGLVQSSEPFGLVRSSERIGLVEASKNIGLVQSSEPIGLVRSSERIGSIQSSKTIGLVQSSEPIGLSRSSEGIGSKTIGFVQSSEPIGFVRSSERIGSIQSSKTIGLVQSSEPIGLVRSSEGIGFIQSSKTIGLVQSSQSIGLVRSSERIGSVRDSITVGSHRSSSSFPSIEAANPEKSLTQAHCASNPNRRDQSSDLTRKSLDATILARRFSPSTGKIGKSLSMHDAINRAEDTETPVMTGMKKFHVVKKRYSAPAAKCRKNSTANPDLLTIILEKGTTKKLGFTIVGGADSSRGNMGIYVKDVMAGGQAADEGTLRPGDEIIAVNGQLVDGLCHGKALQLFKLARPGKLMLHVSRARKHQQS